VPLYEYQCKKCQHRFEKIQLFSDKPIKKCPECGGPVEKLLSAPAIQFKGSGWYVNDYAKKSGGSQSSESSDGAGKSSSAEKSEVKEQAKVESGTGTKSEASSKDSGSKSESKASKSKSESSGSKKTYSHKK
jgi:putative FmdB family regulatory protein